MISFVFILITLPLTFSIVSQILPPVSIFEESPIATIVVDLRPKFHQLGVHPDQAALLQSQPSQPFEYINGRIQLKSRLDREDYVRKRLCLGGNVLECNFTLTLTVHLNQAPFNYILSQPITCHDINDMTPRFSQIDATISMAENVPLGHRVPLEIATDSDSPPFGIDHYRLVDANDQYQRLFSIVYDNQSRELELIVNEKLDRETIDKYRLKLLAIDRGHSPNIGAQLLTIDISDINDSPPKFEWPIYNVSIAENTLPEYLLKVRASDDDVGPNAELTYTLEFDHENLFSLDSLTGILTLAHALDYELHTSYQLKAQVTDHGTHPLTDTCIINIFVIDQNDHAPSIEMKFNPTLESNVDGTMAYVSESFDIQLPLAFVNVHDEDSGENGKSQLTIEPSRLFYLEILRPNYYSIRTLNRFDRESVSSYQIELRARDFGQPVLRRSMILQINITDINDQWPIFQTNYTFQLTENNQIPSVIGQVKAFDADLGPNGQILYSLVSPSSDFFISPVDGILSTNKSFDYESQRHYQIHVRARDQGQPSLESITIVHLHILNENEYAPVFQQHLYTFAMPENRTDSSPICVGPVKAIDRDYGDHVEYELENHLNLFTIDRSGMICSEMIFDREVQEEYNLTILAKDNSTSGSLGTSSVRIWISDINDNPPVFLWPDTTEIRHILSNDKSLRSDRSNPSAQFISDIVVRDDDIGNNSFIQLTLSDDELFYIGSNQTLWLRNGSTLPGTYIIEIQAKNWLLETRKTYHVLIFDRHALRMHLFQNMSGTFSRFSFLIIVIVSFIATGSTIFLLIYYVWIRLHYPDNVEKRFYGSRLIVNDEEKSKQNSPQMKNVPLPSIDNHDYAMIIKPKKNGQPSSGINSDGDFSCSLLSSRLHGTSSSINDLHCLQNTQSSSNPSSSSTVSALTTLTRKSNRKPPMKNVTFQPNNHLFDDIFPSNSSCYHETSSSTFSSLPKSIPVEITSTKKDLRSQDFPTLETVLKSSPTFPQPPPLLNGILLLDQMLARTNDDRTQNSSTSSSNSHSGWYHVTSNHQTRSSVV